MPDPDRRNLLWVLAALLALPLALAPGALGRLLGAAGGDRRWNTDRHRPGPGEPGPGISPPGGSVRRHG
jgi:hypothetical protein